MFKDPEMKIMKYIDFGLSTSIGEPGNGGNLFAFTYEMLFFPDNIIRTSFEDFAFS